MFDTRKPQQMADVLVERCASLTLGQCSDQFKQASHY
jgi:hypothetical protein